MGTPESIILAFLTVLNIVFSWLVSLRQKRYHGRPSDQMEKTTRLITSGMFRYFRHPLYLSLILGGFGAMMKDPGWLQAGLGRLNLSVLYTTARIEEVEMIARFGKEHENYMEETKLFIPRIL